MEFFNRSTDEWKHPQYDWLQELPKDQCGIDGLRPKLSGLLVEILEELKNLGPISHEDISLEMDARVSAKKDRLLMALDQFVSEVKHDVETSIYNDSIWALRVYEKKMYSTRPVFEVGNEKLSYLQCGAYLPTEDVYNEDEYLAIAPWTMAQVSTLAEVTRGRQLVGDIPSRAIPTIVRKHQDFWQNPADELLMKVDFILDQHVKAAAQKFIIFKFPRIGDEVNFALDCCREDCKREAQQFLNTLHQMERSIRRIEGFTFHETTYIKLRNKLLKDIEKINAQVAPTRQSLINNAIGLADQFFSNLLPAGIGSNLFNQKKQVLLQSLRNILDDELINDDEREKLERLSNDLRHFIPDSANIPEGQPIIVLEREKIAMHNRFRSQLNSFAGEGSTTSTATNHHQSGPRLEAKAPRHSSDEDCLRIMTGVISYFNISYNRTVDYVWQAIDHKLFIGFTEHLSTNMTKKLNLLGDKREIDEWDDVLQADPERLQKHRELKEKEKDCEELMTKLKNIQWMQER
ncbi:hypothetical protein BC936DRAFT_141947 [Jimgerdemannia flammicorona]|uniref:GED domain-containing protein n=1 Tax=Jimgerdemannia flammicorona TaxID=994334 RepID=A0A433A1C7_9FUNG|nr:hypothetical protein BC936DRAFT_141947 [Jimgerdemannia flammicorona]